jgi:NADH:ubiquinone oxidoreductase subunit 5 (subunit L)/multisubunit Na+/H+ antiporter MnhA subunit
VVAAGVWFGWRLYGRAEVPREVASVERDFLRNKFYFDEIYRDTAIAFYKWAGSAMAVVEDVCWRATVQSCAVVLMVVAWFNRLLDEWVVNGGFDRVTFGVRRSGTTAAKAQTGQVQTYLRVISLGLAVLVLLFAWGSRK